MRNLTAHLNRRFLKLLPAALIIALILSIIGPNSASANPGWYNTNWQHRKKITIHAAGVPATLTDFPVLIHLDSDADLAADAQNDADDIIFTAADEVTRLSHEIEYFDGATGNLTAWVKIPSLSSTTDTEIYMYYSNAGVGNSENVTDVWDINYKMVQHLEETSGGAGAITDSTANNNDGTDQNSPALGAHGKIDGATGFTGSSNHYINCGNAGSLNITDNITVEAWIYPTVSQSNKGIVAKAQTGNLQYILYLASGGAATFGIHDGFSWNFATGAVPTVGAWNHIVGVYDGTNVNIYVNNVLTVGAAFSGPFQSTTSIVSIANFGGLTSTNAFTGTIDEVRISSYARTPDWITTSYNNQSNPAGFFTLGPEENATVLPTVTTNDATNVQETMAQFNGYLNDDGGEPCEYSFDFGTEPGVYTANGSWSIDTVTTGQNFHMTAIVLTKGQSYYYRAKVRNSAGITYGNEIHFLTKPDGPTALTATANSSSRIDLTWTKGAGAQRTMIRRSTGTYPASYTDGVQVYFDTGTSFSDTSLTDNITFYYRAWSEVTGSQQFSNTFASASATTFAAPPVSASTVGGKVYSVNKAAVLLPWILGSLVSAFILVQIFFYVRKKLKSRRNSGKIAPYKSEPPP